MSTLTNFDPTKLKEKGLCGIYSGVPILASQSGPDPVAYAGRRLPGIRWKEKGMNASGRNNRKRSVSSFAGRFIGGGAFEAPFEDAFPRIDEDGSGRQSGRDSGR